ncbi:MAG: formate dehydrogenase subunit delta [Gammaproteobacteria bacterium]|nr:formate dehydrogenase subunit delta [Gammaproteobacteria bacterium]
MTVDAAKLVRMAEQITANMAYTDDVELVAARVADHLNRFWDPRMLMALAEVASGDAAQLSPALKAAVRQLHGVAGEGAP